ncbi:MAG: ATP--guanido phosphotransferase [Clostridiales bacterium]|nr:ATP--guanido phosphotransferase [Clostridiales bacterium]
MAHGVVMSSRVRLARNYADIPFDTSHREEQAARSIARTANAVKLVPEGEGMVLLRLRDLNDIALKALEESRWISRDLLKHPETTAVMLREEDGVSIMLNEDDHVRIQAATPGLDLLAASAGCFRMEDALARQVSFAYDENLGYLTACPTNAGTGMRASVVMHLPMLNREKQMGNVAQMLTKIGLTIRGVYGEGAEALGDVYQVSNQAALGRTEQDLLRMVQAAGEQLTGMERALREKAMANNRLDLEDGVFRAWGVLRYARVLPMGEMFRHWSQVRMGAAMGLLPVELPVVDETLEQALPGHLAQWAERPLTGRKQDEVRAQRVRAMLRLTSKAGA